MRKFNFDFRRSRLTVVVFVVSALVFVGWWLSTSSAVADVNAPGIVDGYSDAKVYRL